jgi:hypothetical protein
MKSPNSNQLSKSTHPLWTSLILTSRWLALLLILSTCLSLSAAEQALSYPELVGRLTDLEYLARLPAPGEQCAQWSSYDRKSKYDTATGKYVNWDANGDANGYIRREGNQLVLAEMKGPGCIWRIWSAEARNGHVRIYLDGNKEPAVDLPFIGYFDRKTAPFTRPALVHTVAGGRNNYTPIPYQKSCRIVADPGWGLYYHFTYSTFPEGTQVPTFKLQLSPEDNAALDKADKLLHDCADSPPAGNDQRVLSPPDGKIPAGGEMTFTEEGPAAISSFRVKLDGLPTAPASYDILRGLTLEIRWDGEAEPSVWTPIGDFFGTAPGINRYRSYTCGITDDGWCYSHWYMPFSSKAEFRIRNESSIPIGLKLAIAKQPLKLDAARYARLHVKWHRDAFLPAEPERAIDWTMLKTEGSGRFVGVMLHIWNPRGGWWGEGDEKFFVDGEKFPSTFGTGSEDYFGYAWSSPNLFQHALHNQTHNDGWSRGHISVNRWQIADAVPFHRAFEGCIEKYYANKRPTLYAGTAYWYLAPGGKDPYSPVPASERSGYWTPVEVFTVKDVLEGERLHVLAKTGGTTGEQDMTAFPGQWSNDNQLWWTEAKPGDRLDLALQVTNSGPYQINLQLTKAPDYAIVQLKLDGENLGKPIDLYNRSVVLSGPVSMGKHQLTSGQHKLTVEIVGANPKAITNYMFGLDYVKLDPVPQ